MVTTGDFSRLDGTPSSEDILHFNPVLKGSDAVRAKAPGKALSAYQLSLVVFDIIVCLIAFGIAARMTGLVWLIEGRPAEIASLLLLSLVLLVFFPTYHLYSYHHIFLSKEHLVNLFKSFCWSILTLVLIFTLYSYPGLFRGVPALLLIFFVAILLLVLSTFYWRYLVNFLKAIGVSFIFAGIMALLLPNEAPDVLQDWNAVLIGVFLAAGMFLIGRFSLVQVVFNKWMRRYFRRQVLVIGTDEEAKRITSHVVRLNAPFWVAGFAGSQEVDELKMPAGKRRLGELRDIPEIVSKEKIDEVVVTDESMDKAVLVSLLDYCTSEGLTVWFPPKVLPVIQMKLYLDIFCGLPMIRLCSQKNSRFFNKVKHSLDAMITLPAAVMLLPLFLVVGLAIKLNSKGSVFYRANAIGKNGKPFTMYKFRSMKVNNGCDIHKDYVTRLITGEIRPETEGNRPLKVCDDPRITLVGRLLRKTSLDELPQILNVLKGEMSLVGPRPCLPYEFEIYKDWHKKRLSIRPGITGLWQVAGRSEVAFEDMVLLDLYYIYNRNISIDMNIIYETIFAILGRRGAY
jgi:exopolysaccharide biosynthesis polyprenyl glycosylphosphotransferase